MSDLDCRSCGLCCQYVIFPMAWLDWLAMGNLLPPDAERWLRLHFPAHPQGLLIRQPCSAWRSGVGCTMYEDRPALCRAWPVGGEGCRDAREHGGYPMFCSTSQGGAR